MILLWDQDGVLTGNWQELFNYRFSEKFPDIDAPFLAKNDNWNLMNGLDEIGVDAVNTILNLPGFYAELEPAPGAAEALNTMVEEGHTVFICTTPYVTNPTCASDKIAWAEKHFGKGWGRRMVLTSDKTLVTGDILFDDRPTVEGTFLVPAWEHVLVTQPYNENINDGRRRISGPSDWREIVHANELQRAS